MTKTSDIKNERSARPLTFTSPGKFDVISHHSPPTSYDEESHATIQVCIPFPQALYTVRRRSENGRELVHHLGARDILVIAAHQPHAIHWRRPAGIVSLHLSETYLSNTFDLPRPALRDSFSMRDTFVSAAAEQLWTALDSDEKTSPAFTEALVTAIAYRVARTALSDAPTVGAGRTVSALSRRQLAAVERRIDEALDQNITVVDLANTAGMSTWHFMRRFFASHGISPHEYITQKRLTRAQALLSKTPTSITEIALEIGMSHSHFSRTFLQRCGMSPREYRKHCETTNESQT